MTRDDLAMASMRLDAAEWVRLGNGDDLDALTRRNACAVADNLIRAFPEIAALIVPKPFIVFGVVKKDTAHG